MITVGLDFGTHQTKVCIEHKDGVELNYTFMKFSDIYHRDYYTFPSLIGVGKDGILSYGYLPRRYDGRIIRYFKQSAFRPSPSSMPQVDALKNRPLVYCGGGSTFKTLRVSYGGYQDKKQISHKEWNMTSIRDMDEIIDEGLCPILSTAYGLAISTEDDNIKMKPFKDIFEGIRGYEEEHHHKTTRNTNFGSAYGGFSYADDWDAWK